MSENLTCEELEGSLIAVADATAGADQAAEVRTHTAKCQDCARTLDDMRALLGNLRSADPPPERSERFWKQLEADTLARVQADAMPSLAAARKKREIKRPMAWLVGGFAMAAVAAAAIFYVAMKVRSHVAPEAPPVVAELPDVPEHEDPTLAEADDSDTSEVVEDLAADLGESELATLDADLDDQTPELADLGETDATGTETAAEWAPSEGAPAEHMLDDMSAEQLSQVYDELSKTGSGTDAGSTGG